MARIRTVKPELAKHELLFDAEQETGLPLRFAWAMLFTVADREGRFAWRPRRLKADVLPYDNIEFSRVLDAWLTRGLLVKYRVADEWIGWIPTFRKHQNLNPRESASDLPDLDSADEVIDHRNQQVADACGTREARDDDACNTEKLRAGGEGKGREGKERGGDTATPSAHPPDPGSNGSRKPRDRFKPPTVGEVRTYVAERGSRIDAQTFVDHYAAKGWLVGKTPMKDWRAAVRTWESREHARNGQGPGAGEKVTYVDNDD